MYHYILDSEGIHKHTYYFLLIIPSFLIPFLFNFLPPLLLVLYPIKVFQSCLSKCHLNSLALNNYICWKDARLLQEWFGWWKRYEELLWPLFLPKNSSIYCCVCSPEYRKASCIWVVFCRCSLAYCHTYNGTCSAVFIWSHSIPYFCVCKRILVYIIAMYVINNSTMSILLILLYYR